MSELRNQIKRYRNDLGLTQAELARLTKVSRKTINTIENDVFVPSTILALRISQALGKSVEELFSLSDVEDDQSTS